MRNRIAKKSIGRMTRRNCNVQLLQNEDRKKKKKEEEKDKFGGKRKEGECLQREKWKQETRKEKWGKQTK